MERLAIGTEPLDDSDSNIQKTLVSGFWKYDIPFTYFVIDAKGKTTVCFMKFHSPKNY